MGSFYFSAIILVYQQLEINISCYFSSLCRQIILSNEAREPLIVDAFQKADVTLRTMPSGNALIYRIISIPKERFDYNYIKMAPKCILKDKV